MLNVWEKIGREKTVKSASTVVEKSMYWAKLIWNDVIFMLFAFFWKPCTHKESMNMIEFTTISYDFFTYLLFYSSKLLKTAIGPILLSIFVNFLDFYAYRRKFHRLKSRTSQNILILCIVFSILFHWWSKTYRVFMSLFMFGSVWWVGKLFGAVELLGVLAVERLVARVRPHVNLSIFRPGERSVAIFVL